MLFLDAVERLTHDELVRLIAGIETQGFGATLGDAAHAITKRVSGALGRAVAWGASSLPTAAPVSEEPDRSRLRRMGGAVQAGLAHSSEVLDKYAARSNDAFGERWTAACTVLMTKSIDSLRARLLDVMVELAGADDAVKSDPKALAASVLEVAAHHYDIDIKFKDKVRVEEEIADAFLRNAISDLKRAVQKAFSEDGDAALEARLDELLLRLSTAERDALRDLFKVEAITGRTLGHAIRGGAVTATTLGALGALGFNTFLALSAIIKTVSLLVGVTFPFAIYTGSAAAAGMALSPVGLVVLPAVVGGVLAYRGRRQHRAALLAGVIAVLHAKLREACDAHSAR